MSYAQTYGAAPPSNHGYAPPPEGFGYGAPSGYAPPAGAPQSYGGPPNYGAPPAYGGAPGYGAPPTASPYGAPPQSFSGNPDDPRTLFISGFPADVKERELNNLCRFLTGYQASQMHWKNGLAQGFALFNTTHAARAACNALSQLCFDEGSVLRVDMAKKNMFLKTDDMTASGVKRPRTEGAHGERAPSSGAPKVYAETPDNPPCNTLFVGNLGTATSEAELTDVFSKGPGFRQLKLAQGTKNMTAFIEYEDISSAAAMHTINQGITLRSNERGPLKVQFSKTPFGRKREGAYAAGAPQNNMDPASIANAAAHAAALAASYVPLEYKDGGMS